MKSITTATATINVPFYGANLYVVSHNGEPYVPMKPIVEGMGMVWAAQFVKLKQRFAKGVSEIEIPSAGGKQAMICLAFRKFAAWLASIQPNKVRMEIRERVIQYQNECDDVLYEYWTKGEVVNPRKTQTSTDERTPLRDAINMLVGKKGIMYPEAYSYIHQRFGVSHIDELLPEQLPMAIEYVHKLALEGEFLPKEEAKIIPASSQEAPSTSDSRVLLYMRGGVVISSLPIAKDAIVASWETFAELARRNGWIVEHKDDFAAKISTLLA